MAQSVGSTGAVPGGLVQTCPGTGAATANDAARRAADDRLICLVMCCCDRTPGMGAAGQSLKQSCASAAFSAADRALGNRSRYKPEISYNMTESPPSPFMHRVNGIDTTAPSTHWLGRAYGAIEGFRGGQGMVRRPDLTIVGDPCLPPSQNNITRVIEMKFGSDARDDEQDRAYRRIAGDSTRYDIVRVGGTPGPGERGCDCSNGGGEPLPVPVPAAAPRPQEDQVQFPAAQLVGFGVLTAAMAAATAAAAVLPFDGPVLDTLAAAGTAAAAARTAAAWRALMGAGPRLVGAGP